MGVQTSSMTKGLSQARAQMQTFVGETHGVRDALAALGGVFAVGKVVGGLKSAVGAASDLAEQTSKSKVVFGEASAGMIAESQKMADAFGVPKAEFLEGAVNIGQLGKSAGLTAAAAADMGTDFAKLALDVSSFQNVPVAEALAAINSGLRGEAEPMTRFGVLLNEAAVQSEAARMGLARMGSELTVAQKVQARASLITRGLSDANGDLARTSGGAANMMRTIGGRVTNLAADIGTAIQPITDMALRAADGFTRWATDMVQWGLQSSGAVSGFVSVIQNLPAHWSIAQDQFQFGVLAMVQTLAVLPENLATFADWLGNNWSKMIADEWTKFGLGFSNLALNIKNIWSALQTYLAGGKFEFDWTPLATGFQSTVAKLPEFVGPAASEAMVELDKQIRAKQSALADTVAGQQAAAAAAAPTPAAKEAEKLADMAKARKEEKPFAAAVELGSKEARSSILAGRGLADGREGLKDVAKSGKATATNTSRMVMALERIEKMSKPALTALPI